MPMQTSLNISLPNDMRRWVDDQVKSDGFGTASEFVRSLIRQEQKRKARERLDDKLIEAMDSGNAAEMTAADWEKIRGTVQKRLIAKAKRK